MPSGQETNRAYILIYPDPHWAQKPRYDG